MSKGKAVPLQAWRT